MLYTFSYLWKGEYGEWWHLRCEWCLLIPDVQSWCVLLLLLLMLCWDNTGMLLLFLLALYLLLLLLFLSSFLLLCHHGAAVVVTCVHLSLLNLKSKWIMPLKERRAHTTYGYFTYLLLLWQQSFTMCALVVVVVAPSAASISLEVSLEPMPPTHQATPPPPSPPTTIIVK